LHGNRKLTKNSAELRRVSSVKYIERHDIVENAHDDRHGSITPAAVASIRVIEPPANRIVDVDKKEAGKSENSHASSEEGEAVQPALVYGVSGKSLLSV